MEWVNRYYNIWGVTDLTMLTAYANANNLTPSEAVNVMLTDGISNTTLIPLISMYFNYTTATEWSQVSTAIDNNKPSMAVLNGNRVVMITGHNNSGTVKYFDPETGRYVDTPTSNLSGVFIIDSAKP